MTAFDFATKLFGGNSSDAEKNDDTVVTAAPTSVLVVEDDELSRKLITRILEREFNVDVTAMGNGLEGLEYMEEHNPQIIILDLMLPGMNGFEVLKKLRENELLANSKVIVVSAKSRSEDIERGFDLTADEYITKPFQPKEFAARVKRLLQEINA